jgi:hypothetical protein
MSTPVFDIFKKDPSGNLTWIDAVADLQTARHRLSQVGLCVPR